MLTSDNNKAGNYDAEVKFNSSSELRENFKKHL